MNFTHGNIKYKEYEDNIHIILNEYLNNELINTNIFELSMGLKVYLYNNKMIILEIPKSILPYDTDDYDKNPSLISYRYSKEVDALSIIFVPNDKSRKYEYSVLCNEKLFQYDIILHLDILDKLLSLEILFTKLYIDINSYIYN